jgi:glutamate synthase domain-containing protein 1
MSDPSCIPGLPGPQGLYDPRFEHDACGIGFVASIKGHKSHDIIQKGIQVLLNLTHRGACGCDPETGDGAGILIQIPHKLFARECASLGFTLPPGGEYGVGMTFLPVEPHQRLSCEGILERIIREEGLTVLGWRDTPVDGDAIGRVARASQPYIQQIFIGCAAPIDQDALERKLYIVRKRAETEVARTTLPNKGDFYLPSLSARTIVYKGLLLAPQITHFYGELSDPDVMSALCLVHQRFSTNTFPTWQLAHPYRYVAHNGEINTLRGNVNWMHARQSVLRSPLFGADIQKLFPVIAPGGSDSANFDNALELLYMAGRDMPHAMAMLIPEAWASNPHMNPEKRAFYEYHASLMEPWDGPAAIAFTDGRVIGATLDRNGLRPARYIVTHDDLVVMSSETGVLPIAPGNVKKKGRLQPGKMFLVDTVAGRIVSDKETKERLYSRNPYAQWLAENQVTLDQLAEPSREHHTDHDTILSRQRAFGYTDEDLRMIIAPMA